MTFTDSSDNVGLPDTVRALAWDPYKLGVGFSLYVGGDFDAVYGGSELVTQWYNDGWANTYTSGQFSGPTVRALGGGLATVGIDHVLAGGTFNEGVKLYYSAGWVQLRDVRAMAGPYGVFGGAAAVYAVAATPGSRFVWFGGSFDFMTIADAATTVNNVAMYDADYSAVSALFTGVNGPVYGIAASPSFDEEAVFVGSFTTAGGMAVANVAMWTGVAWAALTGSSGRNGVGGVAYTAAYNPTSSEIYVGGDFTTLSGGAVAAANVAVWTGDEWLALGVGVNGVVRSLQFLADSLFAGGDFTHIGTGGTAVEANKLARYDTSVDSPEWTQVWADGGHLGVTGGDVLAMTSRTVASGDELVVGGSFTHVGTSAGGILVNRVFYYRVSGGSAGPTGSSGGR
jgi:hypothetical protein